MRKLLKLGTAFLVATIFNIALIFSLYAGVEVKSATRQIFSEIDMTNKNLNPLSTFSTAPLVLSASTPDYDQEDFRVSNLKRFFRLHDSPLYGLAGYIVDVSDEYGFDYRLLPAIAMTESTLCRNIPENSYNCWGWGINSTQTIRFASYDEGIKTVARGLKKHYIDQGLNTPEAIMAKYAPHSRSWADRINQFLGVFE